VVIALEAVGTIMTGTPSGVAGGKLECEVDGVGGLTVTSRAPLK
jgi:hypothetical protein